MRKCDAAMQLIASQSLADVYSGFTFLRHPVLVLRVTGQSVRQSKRQHFFHVCTVCSATCSLQYMLARSAKLQ